MKKAAVISLVGLLALCSAGCFGPQKLTRALDDWTNQTYVETPWLIGNPVSAVLVAVGYGITWVVDALVLNPVDFWSKSAPPTGTQEHGTPFDHKKANIPGK